MKRIALLASLSALLLSGCAFNSKNVVVGNGVISSKVITLPAFTELSVRGSADVKYFQGDQSIVLTADENLLDLYEFEVENGKLIISTKDGYSLLPKVEVSVKLRSPELNSVNITGSGDVDILGGLECSGDFDFSIAGSGSLEAGWISCKTLSSSISGSGDIEIDELTADKCDISINGSGDASVKCNNVKEVSVVVNGSGDVELSGTAGRLNSKVNGAGDINTDGLQLGGE